VWWGEIRVGGLLRAIKRIVMRMWNKVVHEELGATAVEYGLIAGLIAIAIVAGATLLGTNMNDAFTFIAGDLPPAVRPPVECAHTD
jgi:pilus assembly protein Flp/PilA